MLLVTSVLVTTGCGLNNTLPDAQKVLGPGWVCKTVPDGFVKAGVVYEVKDEIEFFEEDYSDRAEAADAGFGSISIIKEGTYGGVLELLKAIEIISADTTVTAKLDTKSIMKIDYGTTQKNVLSGANVREITEILGSKKLNPTSRYVIIREAYSSKEINIAIDKSTITNMGGAINLEELAKANPKISATSDSNYRLQNTFKEPIGVCGLAYALNIRSGLHGKKSVELGDVYRGNADKAIAKKY